MFKRRNGGDRQDRAEDTTISAINEAETIWYPGIYGGRTTEPWTKMATEFSGERLVELVRIRAKEDGEWAISTGHVGDNEDKMRRFMEWVSREDNIRQCVEANPSETVDWICRDLANASKWVVR